jgi:flavodoxin
VNIGIIVYSQTGHTLSVATRLKERLSAAGHVVTVEQIEAMGPARPRATSVKLRTRPRIDAYDALVFGSPVWGGALASPVTSYLEQISSLEGKKVACLVTSAFAAAGWGRNQTIAQMVAVCESKGATVCGSAGVGWFSWTRKRRISEAVDALSAVITEACVHRHDG